MRRLLPAELVGQGADQFADERGAGLGYDMFQPGRSIGFRLRGATLHLDPCIPRAWRRFDITFRYHASRYEITVENPRGVTRGMRIADIRLMQKSGGKSGTFEAD